jgi:hypothetical protein
MKRLLDKIGETILNSVKHPLFEQYGLSLEFVPLESVKDRSRPLGSDIRLQDPVFRRNSISFRGVRHSSGEACFVTTIFLIDSEILSKIEFWQTGPSLSVLRRVRLVDILSNHQKQIITFGYTAVQDDFPGKAVGTYCLLSAIQKLLQLPSIAAYIEATGSISLPRSEQRRKQIMLSSMDGSVSRLGVTCKASRAVERFAIHMSMSHHNLYHLRTLGKVFLYNLD